MKKKQLFIYCAGGAGREVRDIAERVNTAEGRWSSIRFIDDAVGGAGCDIIRFVDFLDMSYTPLQVEFLIGNGEPAHRERLRRKICSYGYDLTSLVDLSAIVSPEAAIAPGTILYPYVCVSAGAKIDKNCLIYYHTTIAHDSIIHEDCVFSIASSVAGYCEIGNCCFIGANSVVREKVTVDKNCILGAGSVLLHSVPENGVYAGIPAQYIRDNNNKRVFK